MEKPHRRCAAGAVFCIALSMTAEAEFPILSIAKADIAGEEQLGSKEKFWFRRDGQLWLFKEARTINSPSGTFVAGEDWAEKIGTEIAHRLSIPAATVELAM